MDVREKVSNGKRLIDGVELRSIIIAFATGIHSEVLPVDTVMMLLMQTPTVDAMLALLKIARIATGHAKEDNLIDLAGYAASGWIMESG